MAPDVDGTPDFQPFKRNSVNIIAAPTNTGKSYFIAQIVKHRHAFFPGNPVKRVVYILCNSSVQPSSLLVDAANSTTAPAAADAAAAPPISDPDDNFNTDLTTPLESRAELSQAPAPTPVPVDPVDVLYLRLEDFTAPEAILQEQDLVVFEDVHVVPLALEQTINIFAHHLNLCSIFIICQGVIGKKPLFALLSLAHNVILLFNANAVARCIKYVVAQFFHDDELKAYLKQIIAFAQRFKHVTLLEVNSIAREPSRHLAITALEKLSDPANPYCFVHPQPYATDHYEERYNRNFARMEFAAAAAPKSLAHAPPYTYMLVPAANVSVQAAGGAQATEGGAVCAEEAKWNEVNAKIESDIQNAFDHKKWRKARSLASEILRNPNLCISDDGRLLMMRGPTRGQGQNQEEEEEQEEEGAAGTSKRRRLRSNSQQPQAATGSHPVPLLDFLIQCTRNQAPNEPPANPLFKRYAQILLNHSTPVAFISNKALQGGTSGSSTSGIRRRGNLVKVKQQQQQQQQHPQQYLPQPQQYLPPQPQQYPQPPLPQPRLDHPYWLQQHFQRSGYKRRGARYPFV
jgi:DNA segregation ATPase FtsK/SpoIIIE-like protein